MQNIVTVESSKQEEFEQKVNDYLGMGYKISSTSCGFVNSPSYDYCSCYQAVLVNGN